MKNLIYLTILGLVFMATSAPVATALWGSPSTLRGTVAGIQTNILTLAKDAIGTAGNEMVTLEVNEDTQFEQLASLNALNAGDKVEVNYKDEEGRMIATKISLVSRNGTGAVDAGASSIYAPEPQTIAPGTAAPSPAPSY